MYYKYGGLHFGTMVDTNRHARMYRTDELEFVVNQVRPGTVHSYESSAMYDPIGEPGNSPDRGGCVNILTPSRMMIKHSHGMAALSSLIEVEKWEGPE